MTPEFATTQLDSQPILGIRTTVPMHEIGKVMGSLFGEVYGYIQQSGQTPAGMPLAIYHSIPGETSTSIVFDDSPDWNVSVPIANTRTRVSVPATAGGASTRVDKGMKR